MNVILEVKVGDIVNALSGYNEDPLFKSVMSETRARQRYSSQDFVSLFGATWEEMAPGQNLSSYFTSVDLRDKIGTGGDAADFLLAPNEETAVRALTSKALGFSPTREGPHQDRPNHQQDMQTKSPTFRWVWRTAASSATLTHPRPEDECCEVCSGQDLLAA